MSSFVHILLLACLLAAGPAGFGAAFARASHQHSSDDAEVSGANYSWSPDRAPSGPVKIVISLSEQRAYVYRDGVQIGESEVSTGMEGRETPTGVFPILEKEKFHRSSKYNDAPMPFMQRLTWYGVALHGGPLPGYAASHGCIRLPLAFAKKLFDVTSVGTQVVVTDGGPDAVATGGSPDEAVTLDDADRESAPDAP